MKTTEHPLRLWRTRHGKSLRQLATELAVGGCAISHVSLGRIERGTQDPTLALLVALLCLSDGKLSLHHWVSKEQVQQLKALFKKEKRNAAPAMGNPRTLALGATGRSAA